MTQNVEREVRLLRVRNVRLLDGDGRQDVTLAQAYFRDKAEGLHVVKTFYHFLEKDEVVECAAREILRAGEGRVLFAPDARVEFSHQEVGEAEHVVKTGDLADMAPDIVVEQVATGASLDAFGGSAGGSGGQIIEEARAETGRGSEEPSLEEVVATFDGVIRAFFRGEDPQSSLGKAHIWVARHGPDARIDKPLFETLVIEPNGSAGPGQFAVAVRFPGMKPEFGSGGVPGYLCSHYGLAGRGLDH